MHILPHIPACHMPCLFLHILPPWPAPAAHHDFPPHLPTPPTALPKPPPFCLLFPPQHLPTCLLQPSPTHCHTAALPTPLHIPSSLLLPFSCCCITHTLPLPHHTLPPPAPYTHTYPHTHPLLSLLPCLLHAPTHLPFPYFACRRRLMWDPFIPKPVLTGIHFPRLSLQHACPLSWNMVPPFLFGWFSISGLHVGWDRDVCVSETFVSWWW